MMLTVAYRATDQVRNLPDQGRISWTAYMRRAHGTNRNAPPFEWTPLFAMPEYVACAVVKAEDRFFFRHSGFDYRQLLRSVRTWLLPDVPNAGGSTISQQLARNLYLSSERTIERKVREALYTWRLERAWSKVRILELYLNTTEFATGVWGISDGSEHYFRRPAAQLSPFEAAFLASMLPAPGHPLTGRNRLRSENVARRVLRQLHASRVLTDNEYRDALMEADRYYLKLADTRSGTAGAHAPPRFHAYHGNLHRTAALRRGCGITEELRARRRIAG